MSVQTAVDRAYDWVESTRSRVTALSPQSTLDRGYAVVQHQRHIVRRASDLQPGADVQVMVSSGEFSAEVTDIKEGTETDQEQT